MDACSIRRIGAVAALVCLATIGLLTGSAVAIENLKVGDAFPDFSLRRADGAGTVYTSDQIRGQPAVVIFWRPGQRMSMDALRDLKALSGEIGGGRVRLVGVDTARSRDAAIQEVLSGEALPFPVVADPKRKLYGAVGIIVSPTTLVLDAEGVLRFVLASHPRTFRQVMRARLRFLLGEIDQQEMDREIEPTVIKIDHDVAAAWRMYNLGRRLQAEGKGEQALAVFEDAVARYPSQAEARCALGFVKLSQGDLGSAGNHFQIALTHHPTSSIARLGRAAVLARTAQEREAESILLSLLEQPSVAARVRYELGRLYHARGQVERAAAFYREALTVLFPEPRVSGDGGPPSASAGATVHAQAARPPPVEVPIDASAPVGPALALATTDSGVAGETAASPASGAGASPDVTPIVPPADAKYLGIMGCKKCHYQQWRSWQETRMASAFDLLKPNARGDVKQARNLDPRKDYTSDRACLSCHTTGHGFPGGYPADPSGSAGSSSVLKNLRGVGCEGCHGPGSRYVPVHKDVQDTRRKYTQKEFFDAGQYKVDESVCAACHNSKGPCIAPGTVFDFSKRKDEGTHKHDELQLRR